MTIDVLEQAAGLCEGLLLGAALGGLYDGMRILRCRLPFRAGGFSYLLWASIFSFSSVRYSHRWVFSSSWASRASSSSCSCCNFT